MPLTSRALILAKVETTYGVDAAPVVGSDAIITTKPEFTIEGGARERDVVLPYYGKLPPINVGEGLKITFSVEVRGSGTAGTAPRIGALLRACNFTQTVTPGSQVDYDPNSAQDGESITIYFYLDGVLHKLMGCVGTFKIVAKANDPAKFEFEFTGLYAGTHPSTVAFPSPTYEAPTLVPPIFRSAAFNLWGIGETNAIIENFSVDIGNEIKRRADANVASGIRRYFIGNRIIKGECDPEVIALGTYNPWTLWDATTAGVITATIGNTAGNRVVVSMPNVVKDIPAYGDRESVAIYTIPFTAHPTLTAGNNEIKLRFN